MIDYNEIWNSESPKIYELFIQADTNDADYVTSSHSVSEEEIEAMKPIIEMVKNCKKHYNWVTGEYSQLEDHPLKIYPELTEDAYEWFRDFLPFGEYGIHTIESIEYYPIPNKTKLL